MKAIILAAGIGQRLAPITDTMPKCLVEVGGQTLLERHLRILRDSGVTEVVLVVGHKRELIEQRFGKEYAGVTLTYVVNPDYTKGSILSLWAARDHFEGGAVIMDADVLYHPEIMRRLLFSDHPNCLLLDDSATETGEEMMLGARGGRVLTIARRVGTEWDAAGEGVGFFKLGPAYAGAMHALLKKYVDRGEIKVEYETAFDEFFKEHPVGYVTVGDLPWTEIDFVHDLHRARTEILPKLPDARSFQHARAEASGA